MTFDAGQSERVYQAAAREAWHDGAAAELLRLNVVSDSMRPLLQRGDVVVARPMDPHTLHPGAIIVVRRGGDWITHRLESVDEQGWHTQGDNTHYRDEAVTAEQIVGQVIAIERGSQTIDLQQPHWRTIERRIHAVQLVQQRLFTVGRTLSGGRSNSLTRALALAVHWPFQMALRVLIGPRSR